MLRKLSKFVIWICLSIFLANFIVFYPNIPLYFEQMHRWNTGLYSLIDSNSSEIQEFAEEAYKYNNVFPEYYIMEKIKYKSDIENYWNIEYWATPKETLEKGSGDCEDIAILSKSVLDYLEKTYYKNYSARMIDQGIHVYVRRNIFSNVYPDRPLGGAVPDEIIKEYEGLSGLIKRWTEIIPVWRWILYCIILILMTGFVIIM